MLLLVFVTIYIWIKFSDLAKSLGYPKNKWGFYGAGIYLLFGFGVPIFVGILVGLGFFYLDFENIGAEIILSLLGYSLGGTAAYLLYQKFSKLPSQLPDIDSFGKNEAE
ncbi:MAG: hypothetical protein MUF42_12740 [Cytophagaceae bacterium]|jgi:hypothetical protein|nr:hypothetical protein [Cytophagaceae bacterium]